MLAVDRASLVIGSKPIVGIRRISLSFIAPET
ncbi:hypothetical protein JOH52_000827 [Sinorhizobium meliloti]|nr:hypothetical protein [Sinorhizobium meliloti]